jgi:alpha-galactosidase
MKQLQDYSQIPHGDMPGDKICINDTHVAKANLIYPQLLDEIRALRADAPARKLVIGVCGGSGVGKSETASLLGWLLIEDGMPAYILSGDNYPHRIPVENDAERRRVYEAGGEAALRAYLGSQAEEDYEQLNKIIESFKAGDPIVRLKRMGRTPDELWYDDVDMSETQFMIIEWTHANSDLLRGVDITVLLNSTPEETLAHRRKRARDGAVDSPFTMLVLKIEQEQLMTEAHKAKIIVTKDGRIIPYEEYCRVMGIQI